MRDFHIAQKEEQTLWWIAQVRGGHKPRARHVFVGQWSSGEEQWGAGRGSAGPGESVRNCHCKIKVLKEGHTMVACH